MNAPCLGHGLLLLCAVWSVLIAGRFVAPVVGAGPARCMTFGLACALVLCWRRAPRRRPRVTGWLTGPIGLVAGWGAYPALASIVAWVGLAIGLSPISPAGEVEPDRADQLATLILAPIFEEILYRDHLLLGLAPRAGWPQAILISSALFALPHLEPWPLLGTFIAGLVLASVRMWTRHVTLCIGLHAGFNLASQQIGAAG